MYRHSSLIGIAKKVIADPESKVFVVWGILAFIVAYGADSFGAFLPIEFLQEIPAMREWIGKTQYGYEATVLLSFMWLSLPLAVLVQVLTTERGRYLPVTLKKLVALFVLCLMIYFGLVRGLGSDIEDYRPYGFMSRMYYGSMPGMIFVILAFFSTTVITIGILINWLLGMGNKGSR